MDSIGEMWMNNETMVSPSIEDVDLDEGVDEWEVSSSCVKIGPEGGDKNGRFACPITEKLEN